MTRLSSWHTKSYFPLAVKHSSSFCFQLVALFDVSSSQFDVETTVINQTCGEQGSIAIESISPVGAYDIYWHDISDNDLDGIIDVYQKLNDDDGDGIAGTKLQGAEFSGVNIEAAISFFRRVRQIK